jgi:hypothetical protein
VRRDVVTNANSESSEKCDTALNDPTRRTEVPAAATGSGGNTEAAGANEAINDSVGRMELCEREIHLTLG